MQSAPGLFLFGCFSKLAHPEEQALRGYKTQMEHMQHRQILCSLLQLVQTCISQERAPLLHNPPALWPILMNPADVIILLSAIIGAGGGGGVRSHSLNVNADVSKHQCNAVDLTCLHMLWVNPHRHRQDLSESIWM